MGKSLKQRFCNTFYVNLRFQGSVGFVFMYSGILFSESFLERVFVVLGVVRCHFWLTFGAKGCFALVAILEALKIMKKGFGAILGNGSGVL